MRCMSLDVEGRDVIVTVDSTHTSSAQIKRAIRFFGDGDTKLNGASFIS